MFKSDINLLKILYIRKYIIFEHWKLTLNCNVKNYFYNNFLKELFINFADNLLNLLVCANYFIG